MQQASNSHTKVSITSKAENSYLITSSMETFSSLLALCVGNSPVTGEFPAQKPVTQSFDVFFDLPLNKRLNKQSWGWWFETPSRSLWRHCNGCVDVAPISISNGSGDALSPVRRQSINRTKTDLNRRNLQMIHSVGTSHFWAMICTAGLV